MMTPQSPQGDIAQARLGVSLAVSVLQRVAMQSQDPGVKTPLANVIAELTKAFGPFDQNMTDSEKAGLLARAKGPGSPGNTPTPPPQGAGAGQSNPKRAAPPAAA